MGVVTEIARRWSTRGLRSALRNVAAEAQIMRRHRAGLRDARKFGEARGLRIQLGSGGQPKPGWVNVDLTADADLQLDLRERLPFRDDAAAIVYAEHVLEHLVYPGEVRHLLSEVHRILEPGGVVKLVVPDAGRALEAYGLRERDFFAARRVRSYLTEEPPTPMHIINYIFRQDGQHRYAYDEETLAQVLQLAGFVNARPRSFDPEIDSERRRGVNSLYMEAEKPTSARSPAPSPPSPC